MSISWKTVLNGDDDLKSHLQKMRRRRKQNVESTERERYGANYSLVNLRFIVHLVLVIIHFVVLIMAVSYNNWPRYCVHNNWAFFVLVGLLISAAIISTSTFVTYIVFEDLNWVIMSCLLFFYGLMFTVCGSLYISDGATNCTRCEIPIMRVDENLKNGNVDLPMVLESLRYRKLKFLSRNSRVVSDTGRRLEISVAYISFILGIFYLILFSFYIIRREKA